MPTVDALNESAQVFQLGSPTTSSGVQARWRNLSLPLDPGIGTGSLSEFRIRQNNRIAFRTGTLLADLDEDVIARGLIRLSASSGDFVVRDLTAWDTSLNWYDLDDPDFRAWYDAYVAANRPALTVTLHVLRVAASLSPGEALGYVQARGGAAEWSLEPGRPVAYAISGANPLVGSTRHPVPYAVARASALSLGTGAPELARTDATALGNAISWSASEPSLYAVGVENEVEMDLRDPVRYAVGSVEAVAYASDTPTPYAAAKGLAAGLTSGMATPYAAALGNILELASGQPVTVDRRVPALPNMVLWAQGMPTPYASARSSMLRMALGSPVPYAVGSAEVAGLVAGAPSPYAVGSVAMIGLSAGAPTPYAVGGSEALGLVAGAPVPYAVGIAESVGLMSGMPSPYAVQPWKRSGH